MKLHTAPFQTLKTSPPTGSSVERKWPRFSFRKYIWSYSNILVFKIWLKLKYCFHILIFRFSGPRCSSLVVGACSDSGESAKETSAKKSAKEKSAKEKSNKRKLRQRKSTKEKSGQNITIYSCGWWWKPGRRGCWEKLRKLFIRTRSSPPSSRTTTTCRSQRGRWCGLQ